MTAKPLLTLETLEPERPLITIDGTAYELAVLGDFGLTEQARLARLLADATAIEDGSTALGDADDVASARDREALVRRAADVLDETVRMIVRAPAAVLTRLSEPQKIQVVLAFVPTVQGMGAPTTGPSHPKTRNRSMSGGSRRTSAPPMASARG